MARKVSLTRVARLAYWSVHIEAWLRSGLSQRAYCGHQRLAVGKMRRWVQILSVSGSTTPQSPRKPGLSRVPRTHSARSKALIAFWSMHVEALNWSGLPVGQYAHVHGLSVYSLKHWRSKLDSKPPDFDWRERLHPSARPGPSASNKLSNDSDKLSNGTPQARPQSPAPSGAPPDGRSNRRRFTEAQKLAIVAETERLTATVSSVARRHDIAPSMVSRWRSELGLTPTKGARLATVRLVERRQRGRPKKPPPLVLHHILPAPPDSVAVTLADGRCVYAPAGTDPDVVRRFVAERESAS